MPRSLEEFYPEALWWRRPVHSCRKVWTAVPTGKVKEVTAMQKAIQSQEDRAAERQKAEQVAAKLKKMKLADAAALGVAGTKWGTWCYLDMNRLAEASERHERARKNLRLPLEGAEHHQIYASTNVRKILGTTLEDVRPLIEFFHFGSRSFPKR